MLVEEQLVGEAHRRRAAEDAANPGREVHAIDQILAGHLVIHRERMPAHRPVGLPLQLAGAAGDRRLVQRAVGWVPPADRPAGDVAGHDRHLHDDAGAWVDRQKRRIGGAPVRAQGGQHGRHHLVVAGEHALQRVVEAAGSVIVGRRGELVIEAEAVKKTAQPGVVVGAETVVGPERVGHRGQRTAEMLCQHLAVRHVVRHLAQAVHIVAEGKQARRPAGQLGEGVTHPGGARHLAEGADMRQARRPVAGFEQRLALARGGNTVGNLLRLLERPCLGKRSRAGWRGTVADCIGHYSEAMKGGCLGQRGGHLIVPT